LTRVIWQQGEDKTTVQFWVALSDLWEFRLSESSWRLLCTCVQNQLLLDKVASFRSALQRYFTNEEVREHNYSQLAAEGRPVKRIVLQHTGQNALKASVEEADNLSTKLLVCIGARVMLITNTWTENRLVNGSVGTIEDILWDTCQDLSVSIPSLLPICFSKYSGPDFPIYRSKIISIFPVTC
jgi:hypothetical protein